MAKNRVKYTRLRETVKFRKDKDEFCDEQFEDDAPIKPPVKSIALAIFLFVVGGTMLVLGSLLFAGVIGEDFGNRAVPLLVLGSICFVPGFYNVRTAYLAWKGNYGYSYSDIPQ